MSRWVSVSCITLSHLFGVNSDHRSGEVLAVPEACLLCHFKEHWVFTEFSFQPYIVAVLLSHLTLLSVFSASVKDGTDKTVMGILVSYKVKVKLTVPG